MSTGWTIAKCDDRPVRGSASPSPTGDIPATLALRMSGAYLLRPYRPDPIRPEGALMHTQSAHVFSATTDEELFRLFQKGEEQAYVQLVRRYKHRLTNFVYRHLGEMDEAADVVQEAFVRVYSHRNAYHEGARFTTWLYRIALNLATSELRRQTRRRRYLKEGLLSGFAVREGELDLLDHSRRPDSFAESILTFELVQKALLQISPPLREVIILREIENMSYEEIVEITGVELGTVKSRINRARAQLQKLLRDVYREDWVPNAA
jgi:RNA polymerase sigma-70 factor (ECF subfamily)